MSNKTIRLMKTDDLSQVCAIENSIFSLPWSMKSFEDALSKDNNIYLVCDCDGKIAGYCGLWTVLGEGNITNMAVAADYRRRGIAYELMQEMERLGEKKQVTSYFLEVRESNAGAIALYEKQGYSNIGIRKRFYEKPVENAIIMAKQV